MMLLHISSHMAPSVDSQVQMCLEIPEPLSTPTKSQILKYDCYKLFNFTWHWPDRWKSIPWDKSASRKQRQHNPQGQCERKQVSPLSSRYSTASLAISPTSQSGRRPISIQLGPLPERDCSMWDVIMEFMCNRPLCDSGLHLTWDVAATHCSVKMANRVQFMFWHFYLE